MLKLEQKQPKLVGSMLKYSLIALEMLKETFKMPYFKSEFNIYLKNNKEISLKMLKFAFEIA